MKRINLNIGIVFTEQVSMTPYMRAIYNFGYARLVTPGEKVGALDAVIIPDGIGTYVGMRAFASNLYQTIQCDHLCPYAEIFRIGGDRGFDYYKAKQTLLIGVGEGRFMLWDDLGYRCKIQDKIYLVDPQDSSLIITKREKDAVAEFRSGNFIGIENLASPILMDTLRNLQIIRSAEVEEEMKKYQEDVTESNPLRKTIKIK